MPLRIAILSVLTAVLCLGPACGDDSESDDEHEDHGDGGHSDASAEQGDAGDEPGDAATGGDGIEIAGDWSGEFGAESISDDDWNGSAIVSFDNDVNSAITQNAEDADFSPGAFNKIVWTEPNDEGFYYCTVSFGAETAEEADESAMPADEDDLEAGCGEMGFAWTQLMPQ